jgi:hypothetical protein
VQKQLLQALKRGFIFDSLTARVNSCPSRSWRSLSSSCRRGWAAAKAGADFAELAASLKRCPDTNPEFFNGLRRLASRLVRCSTPVITTLKCVRGDSGVPPGRVSIYRPLPALNAPGYYQTPLRGANLSLAFRCITGNPVLMQFLQCCATQNQIGAMLWKRFSVESFVALWLQCFSS